MLYRATRLNHTLASLLWDLSKNLSNEYGKKIHDILQSVGLLVQMLCLRYLVETN
jgi:hypothetical protein